MRGVDHELPYNVSPISLPKYAHCHRTWRNWTWSVPGRPTCSDPSAWCAAFAGRDILFVGDSLLEQMALSLAHRLGMQRQITRQSFDPQSLFLNLFQNNRANEGPFLVGCHGRTRLSFVRNDLACDRSWSDDCRTTRENVCRPFAQLLDKQSQNTTLVLNQGAHHLGLTLAREAQHTRLLAAWLVHNVTLERIVWLISSPGHAGCENATEPLDAPYTPPSDAGHGRVSYSWHTFVPRNARRAALLDVLLPGRVTYIDAASMSNRRADAHMISPGFGPGAGSGHATRGMPIDCMHWCLPGPPDDWNTVLKAIVNLRGACLN